MFSDADINLQLLKKKIVKARGSMFFSRKTSTYGFRFRFPFYISQFQRYLSFFFLFRERLQENLTKLFSYIYIYIMVHCNFHFKKNFSLWFQCHIRPSIAHDFSAVSLFFKKIRKRFLLKKHFFFNENKPKWFSDKYA